jgi:hypothetical protein
VALLPTLFCLAKASAPLLSLRAYVLTVCVGASFCLFCLLTRFSDFCVLHFDGVQVSSERFHVLYAVGLDTPYSSNSPRNIFDPAGHLRDSAYEQNAIDRFENLLRESCLNEQNSAVARSLRDLLFADSAAAVERVRCVCVH